MNVPPISDLGNEESLLSLRTFVVAILTRDLRALKLQLSLEILHTVAGRALMLVELLHGFT